MPQIVQCKKCNHKIYLNHGHDCSVPLEHGNIWGFCKLAESIIMNVFDTINHTHYLGDKEVLLEILNWAEKDKIIISSYAEIFNKSESKVRNKIIEKVSIKLEQLK